MSFFVFVSHNIYYLGPHHNNYDGVASSVTSCLSVRLSDCPTSKCVNFFCGQDKTNI